MALSQSALRTYFARQGGASDTSLLDKVTDFPIEETEDFYKFSNFRSCLLEVYVQLDQRNSLQDDLKEAIQSFQY